MRLYSFTMTTMPHRPIDDDRILQLLPERLDDVIAGIDRRIAAQVDLILHDPTFQRLERAWRGLWFVVERTLFDENIRIDLLNCSKEDLRLDFDATGPADKGGLHAIVYARAIGSGHEPYGAILANFEFGPEPEEMALLQRCATVALLAQAPFVAAASPRLLGIEGYRALGATDGGREPDVLRRLREEEEGARALGLVLPRFLLRAPFGRGERTEASFAYEESTEDHESYCWGNAIFAFATRLTDSFARYRWCPNIIGPGGGGLIEGLPQPEREGVIEAPTEVALSFPQEAAIAERGLIPLVAVAPGQACFFSASSLRAPRSFGDTEEARAAEMNYMLGSHLPYFFIVARVVHYLKVIYRSYQHAFETPEEAEKELNDWLAQYVADRNVVTAASRGRKPLRKVKVRILNTEHESDWYRLEIQLRPHFKYMGAFFTLGVHNRIEKR
ncbi:type VI secretion system contractile sheath large subunit [Sorangium sp. So ce385]|uniref:type VI secretion system contractile sheath large subunit n=1 Tax=Sorangium sp. So ce385 TaxID=3133308 RepID=UPI003F5C1720